MRLSSVIKWIISPVTWFFKTTDFDETWIKGFVNWFGSIPGFKQQMAFMLGWVLIAIFYPVIDPNAMHLMVFLTVYSGITQPMIAIQNAYSGYMNVQLLKANQIQMEAMKSMIEELRKDKRKEE